MATYEQIPLAGNIAGQNVFKVTFSLNDSSDIPRLTAWDDYNMNTTIKETLTGTLENGNVSSVAASDTSAAATIDGWATGLPQQPGGMWGNTGNRLKGNESYVLLGTTAPLAGQSRTFQLAIGVNADSTPGITGHDIVLGITVFYTTATPPDILLEYNASNSETTPIWKGMNLQQKGVSTLPPLPNTIYATGPDSTTSNLDPVTKPDTGEKWAEEYWTRTV